MEGTVTIPVEEYERMRDLTKLIENEKVFRTERDYCGGKATFFKLEVDEFVAEKNNEIETLERIQSAYILEIKDRKKEISEKDALIERLEDTCKGYNEMFEKNQNKSFWQRIFNL